MKKDYSIFFDDYKVYHEGKSFAIFRLYPAGEVHLKSGEIIASDPFNSDTKPLKKKVKPGKYPVTIVVKHYDVASDVIAAIVRFNEENPVKPPLLPDLETGHILVIGDMTRMMK